MIQKIICISILSIGLLGPYVGKAATEACYCNTSRASGEVVPFSTQAECEINESRKHPTEETVTLRNCVWSTPETSPLLPLSDSMEGNNEGFTGSLILLRLGSLNKLSVSSVPELIGRGLQLFTGFFGSIALIMIAYGGIQIMIARGQSDKINEGAKIIIWASIGLVTMMLSYVLVSFVFGAIT
jgi:hypothetical protein